jgi:chromosome segregation ATPase
MSAQLHSLERLLDFQSALATYTHHAKEAISGTEVEIRRTLQWLEQQLALWHAEVRRAEEEVFKAKQELARRRMMKFGDRPADTTEQEIALAKAQRRLEYAAEKQAACQRWLRQLPEAIDEYQAFAINYQSVLESDVPRMHAFLDRKMDLLEAYMQVAAPQPPPTGETK